MRKTRLGRRVACIALAAAFAMLWHIADAGAQQQQRRSRQAPAQPPAQPQAAAPAPASSLNPETIAKQAIVVD